MLLRMLACVFQGVCCFCWCETMLMTIQCGYNANGGGTPGCAVLCCPGTSVIEGRQAALNAYIAAVAADKELGSSTLFRGTSAKSLQR